MDTGINHGVAAMRSTEKRLETITSNLANINATGFKRQASVTRSFWIGEGKDRHIDIATQRATDFKQGPLAHTGNSLDLALEGSGFFAIETTTGRSYTRDGEFHLDNTGTLLNVNGYPIAWDGQRGKLDPTGETITIDGSGQVLQGDRRVGKLVVNDFSDLSKLEDDGQGQYRPADGMKPLASTALIHQGNIERSNVTVMDELVEMVFAQRRFENSTTVMRSIDQTYKRLNQPHN
ncbi:MAG: flagellar hook basal-body protein [Planctomycetota bacterium]|nr:flagellar hook basal-body protein [Planctomycetota bacterium]